MGNTEAPRTRIAFIHGINVDSDSIERMRKLLETVLLLGTRAHQPEVESVFWGSTGRILSDITMMGNLGPKMVAGVREQLYLQRPALIVAHSMGSALARAAAHVSPVLHIGSPVGHPIYGRALDMMLRGAREPSPMSMELWNADDPVANHWLLGRRAVPWEQRRLALAGHKGFGEHAFAGYVRHPLFLYAANHILRGSDA